MNKEEIESLFKKYKVRIPKEKQGQSECYECKRHHKYSLTWTSFLYEYKENYYCFEHIVNILLQTQNINLINSINAITVKLENCINSITVKLKAEKLNIYQIVRLKAYRTKCNEILEMIDNIDVSLNRDYDEINEESD